MVRDPNVLTKAQRHLARRDPILQKLIRTIGPCTLWHNPDGFTALVRSIVSQQLSTRAAASIFNRLEQALPDKCITPQAILSVDGEILRSAGLSTAKARSLHDLAEKVHTQAVPLEQLLEMDDEAVINCLLPVRGIGRWTAQMFLIFSLGRLDVLPVDDLGLRASVQAHYSLETLPDKIRLGQIAEPWRPYRSIATWYFWRSKGAVPQSDVDS